MPVDECPRVTVRVAVFLTVAVLLACLFADSLKCRPGRSAFCAGSGRALSRDYEPSYNAPDFIFHNYELSKMKCAYEKKGSTPSFLVYVVELMRELPDDREFAAPDVPTEEVNRRTQGPETDNMRSDVRSVSYFFLETLRQRVSNHSYRLCGNDYTRAYYRGDRNWYSGRLKKISGKSQNIEFVRDVVFLPDVATSTEEENNDDTIDENMEGSTYPFPTLKAGFPSWKDQLSGRATLHQYFPSLARTLKDLWKKHRTVGDGGFPCLMVDVYIFVNPGVAVGKAVKLPKRTSFSGAKVQRSLAQFSSVNARQVSALLRTLLIVGHPYKNIGLLSPVYAVWPTFPSHAFQSAPSSRERLREFIGKADTTYESEEKNAFNEILVSVKDAAVTQDELANLTAAYCDSSPGAADGSRQSACSDTCSTYVRESAITSNWQQSQSTPVQIWSRRSDRDNAFYMSSRSGQWVYFPKNCYFYLQVMEEHYRASGDTSSRVFADCLHLTELGVKLYAQCMVESFVLPD